MSDHSLGLQKTIFDALDGDSTLTIFSNRCI